MLVLSRRPGESILIGKDIEIVVLSSDGYQVRLGIRAPRDVTVLRRELMKQVVDENRRAASGRVNPLVGKALANSLGPLPRAAAPTPTETVSTSDPTAAAG